MRSHYADRPSIYIAAASYRRGAQQCPQNIIAFNERNTLQAHEMAADFSAGQRVVGIYAAGSSRRAGAHRAVVATWRNLRGTSRRPPMGEAIRRSPVILKCG